MIAVQIVLMVELCAVAAWSALGAPFTDADRWMWPFFAVAALIPVQTIGRLRGRVRVDIDPQAGVVEVRLPGPPPHVHRLDLARVHKALVESGPESSGRVLLLLEGKGALRLCNIFYPGPQHREAAAQIQAALDAARA